MYPKDKLILSPNVPKEWVEKTRNELQGYYGHCSASDKAIGSILDKMKELNLKENTIVVFSSDHGEMMGSHGMRPFMKQLAWDASIKVPFLIHYPGIGKNKGAVVNAPINTPDILPSLLAMSGLEIPESVEGEDLSDLIKSTDPNVDRAALVMNVCPFTSEYKYHEYRAIRTKQFTYARTPEGASKLFDNDKDPYQMNNLLDQSEYAELQKDLDAKLNEALQNIGDDFKPRDYYLNKWNLILDDTKNCINYWDFNKGGGVVQTPKHD
jgi:arylsulfatase A-like enzyme